VTIRSLVEERRAIRVRGTDRLGRHAIQEGVCVGVEDAGAGSRRLRIELSNGSRIGLPLSPADAIPKVGMVVRVRGALGCGDEGTRRLRLA
jgi:hypothetical protein